MVGGVNNNLALAKKYGLLGTLVVVFPFVEPYITKYLTEVTTAKYSQIVKEEIYRCSAMQNKLSDETLLQVCKYVVGKQSIHKAEAIKRILLHIRLDSEYNINRAKLAIRNELIKQSNRYIEFLNTLAPHPNIGYVGEYIKNEFDMDKFLQDIYVIALNEDCSIENREDDIMQHMLAIQDIFFNKMYQDIKGN